MSAVVKRETRRALNSAVDVFKATDPDRKHTVGTILDGLVRGYLEQYMRSRNAAPEPVAEKPHADERLLLALEANAVALQDIRESVRAIQARLQGPAGAGPQESADETAAEPGRGPDAA